MAKAKRIYQLAKELGVESKVIVEKCKKEGVPDIKDHMSTVKVGLALTIEQWFSEEHVGTAIEQAEQVDLKKVRKRARPKKKAVAKGDDAGDAGDASESATAVVEPEAEQTSETDDKPVKKAKAATRKAAAKKDDGEKADEDAATEEVATSDAQAPAVEVEAAADAPEAEVQENVSTETAKEEKKPEPAKDTKSIAAKLAESQAKAKARSAPVGKPNVPTRPDNVTPMGEKLEKPKGVQLKGPRVIRVEQPEHIPAPRGPRSPRPPRNTEQPDYPTPGEVEGITRSRGPKRGGGAGGGSSMDQDSPAKKPRRQQRNVRRGRTADALLTGPSRLTEADMEELDARLKGATGFVKQRRRDMGRRSIGQPSQAAVVSGGKVAIEEPITIKKLSSSTGIKSADIIKYLFKKGIMATINSAIETETAMEIAFEYDIELEVKEQESAIQVLEKQFQERESVDVRPRPAVVTVLGHVDHGKTSLLDRIRAADVADHEDGGITQHVGAYRVTIKGTDDKEKTVVFLDTPGHEAFTSMRSRGAQLTDLIVLVVAADDGVMPQTIESINHAKAANVPVIVALNKIDRPDATSDNIQRIYGQLAEHGLNPVEWGGETEIIRTSAISGEGITDLVEVLDYQAELLNLTAEYSGAATGSVIETEMQTGRGSVARVLVQNGQIRRGDFIVIGRAFGRVRDMTDDHGKQIEIAGPATPLELSGIDLVPDAGDKFYVTDSYQKAEQIASQYREQERQQQLATKTKITLDNFAQTIQAGQQSILRVVLKADVQGSIDVLRKSLEKLGNEEVAVRVLHAAVGGVTESDVLLADASDAVVIGFHVVATPAVREIADERDVDIRLYRVIYDVMDEVKRAMEGMLTPETREEELGRAEVKEVFRIGKVGNVAGCIVADGVIQRSGRIRVIRDGVVVTDNRALESLRRVKDDVKEVQVGTECGIRLVNFEDLKPGDELICYKVEEIKRTLA